MKINLIVFLIVPILFFSCSGGSTGGSVSGGTQRSSAVISTFACDLSLDSDLSDKRLSCSHGTDISYSSSNNSICRVDNLDDIAVSTCMESRQPLSIRTCRQRENSVDCPDIDFSCEVSSLSTSDNWILSCSDNVAVSMDISNSELCRIDLNNGTGFCLDNKNTINRLPIVWRGYARDFVEIGDNVALDAPMWGSDNANFSYSATPADVCSVNSETGLVSINGFGDCRVTLTVLANGVSKVIKKTVHGRLIQKTSWDGYMSNSMEFGAAQPTPMTPQYAPTGAHYRYSSESSDICTVNSGTGEITAIMESGDCVIAMTSSANHYADREISFTLRINPLNLPPLTWTAPYGSGRFDTLTTVSAPSNTALSGQGNLSVTLENYRSTTPTICSVDENTGVPTLLFHGDCIIEASVSAPGYASQTLSTTLTVSLATMSLSWTSPIYSLGNTDSVQPNEPSGFPVAAAVSGLTYSSETKNTCRVDSGTGEITGIANGICTARLTAMFPGYELGSVDLSITIADPQNTAWTGYSRGEITFGTTPPTLNEPTNAPSGVSFSYSSLTENICTVDETTGALTLVDDGDCRIRLISSASGYGDKLFEFDLRVLPAKFSRPRWGDLYGRGPFNIESTGLAPTPDNLENVPEGTTVTIGSFESLTPDICQTDESGNLTLLRDGTCRLRAVVSAAGYTNQTISGSVEVGLAQMNLSWTGYSDSDNTITFGDTPPALEVPSLTTATTHTLSYTSNNGNVCRVNKRGELTILRDGDCTITLTASAPGYRDTVLESTQTINLGTITGVTWNGYRRDNVGIGGLIETVAPSGVPENASIAYTSNRTICTVDEASGVVTGKSEGTCTVTLSVTQLGCEKLIITDDVSIRTAQNIEWSGYSKRKMVFNESPPKLNPPTNTEGVTVTYASLTTDVCTVDQTSGGLVILNHGLCRVSLTALKDNHGTKVMHFDLNISPKDMGDFGWDGYDTDVIAFPNSPNLEEPRGFPSGASLTYSSQTEDLCTVDGTSGELTIIDNGVCTITLTATAAGYTSARINSDIIVTPLTMTFTWTGYSARSTTFGLAAPTFNAPTDMPREADFRYSSNSLDVCLVNPENGELTLSGVGDCMIVVVGSAPGYTNAIKTFRLKVTPGMMSSLRWSGYVANSIDFGETPISVRPEGLPRGATFGYTSSTSTICTVNAITGETRILSDGDCIVTLTATAPEYNDATVSVTLTVNPLDMDSLAWSGYSPNSIILGSETIPSLNQPTGRPLNTVLSYTSSDETICIVDRLTGALLSILSHGTCNVNLVATATGYNDKTITAAVAVTLKVIQGVAWVGYNANTVTLPNVPSLIAPTGIPSGASASYTSFDETICTVDSTSGALTLVDQGTCRITLTVSQAGYGNFERTFDLTVNPREMGALTWTGYSASSILIKGPFVYPDAVAGAPNGARYRYFTSTPNICSVEKDGDLWGRDLGTCRVSVSVSAQGYRGKNMATNVTVTRGRVAISSYHSCALLSNGQVKCWGEGTRGMLGQEHTNILGNGANEMGIHLPSVNLGTGLTAKFISVGKGYNSLVHSCAILESGKVKCWGDNNSGALGQEHRRSIGDNGGEMGDNLIYTDLGTNRTAKILGSGFGFSCAILDNNKVKCWGGNGSGQLGAEDTKFRGDEAGEMGDQLPYVKLGLERTAKDIAVGVNHACVLLDNSKVKCWGTNGSGELGQGHTNSIGDEEDEMEDLNPIDLGDNRTAKRIAAGGNHSCAIMDNNDLICWGSNGGNRLGIDLADDKVSVGGTSGEMGNNLKATHLVSQDAIQLNAGVNSNCVIRKNGTLYCWGSNDYGQLGLGHTNAKGNATTRSEDVDVDLGSQRKAKIVDINSKYACAFLDNNGVKCWGRNRYGQLGQGHTRSLGDGANEMGDNLPEVDLVPDMIALVWGGYTPDTIDEGDNAPSLSTPTGAPTGATFAYSTTTESVCTVGSSSGALTILSSGTCTITLTASADGYRDGVKTFNVTVNE